MSRTAERWLMGFGLGLVTGIAVWLWQVQPLAGGIWTAWWVCMLGMMLLLIGGDQEEDDWKDG